ncbi:MAG: ATP-binding protein [Verrucomicrobiota bacterium]|nr:ATP-binding protein [Verrucomicrobiota bacterium]MDP7047862.1 ATP-binding protein [Verrucomicrobiota bacterium]
MLPVKAVYFLVLIFYLYFTEWPEMDADRVRWTLLRTIQWFFVFCLIVNVIIGVMLIRMEEFSTRVLREVVFLICLFDALLLAMMTELTGGFESFLFWMFLGLQIRNAISMPIASSQIVANLSVSVIYLCAGAFDIVVARSEEELGDIAGEPVMLRALLLMLMTACGYGLQVLIDKQRRMDAEEDEFDRRQSQLQASGRLAAEIAHQVKNPLSIINNAAFALDQTTDGNELVKRQLGLIREEVNKADQIITKLMGYAQLVEGRLAKLDVNETLDAAIMQVFPKGSRFATRVRREYGIALPPLLAQPEHISEVFVNVIQNAREELADSGEIQITTSYEGDYNFRVIIEDNGSGIPSEMLESVFEPYHTTKEKGTGLGLAIVRHNTELYGGTVEIESELGKYTRFNLLFPGRAAIRLQTK